MVMGKMKKAFQSGGTERLCVYYSCYNTLPVQPGGWAQQQHMQQEWI